MALAGLQVWAVAAVSPDAVATLTQAEVSHDDGASWAAVTPPDQWSRRGPRDRAAAPYRLPFELTASPAGPVAISFERLGVHHRVSWNGHLLAQRGDAGRQSSQAQAPDLLLTDPRLGDRTGHEAIKAFRQALGTHPRCVLATGDATGVEAQALARQGTPVLAKPASGGVRRRPAGGHRVRLARPRSLTAGSCSLLAPGMRASAQAPAGELDHHLGATRQVELFEDGGHMGLDGGLADIEFARDDLVRRAGHQVGGGSGKTAMTVLGAIGGAMAGREVEQHQRTTSVYEIRIRRDDGGSRSVSRDQPYVVGQKVRVASDQLSLRN